ncbi:MAG: Nif3-like dinuclear metal center hexameric protein [Bacteroidota bacterium]
MKISTIISFLESLAHPALQEKYDNAGLILGDANRDCTGILVALDSTEEVIKEAIAKKMQSHCSPSPADLWRIEKELMVKIMWREQSLQLSKMISRYMLFTQILIM